MLSKVKIKILDKNLKNTPSFYTPGSAGLDLRASLDNTLILLPNQTELIPTGWGVILAYYLMKLLSQDQQNQA